MSKPFPAGDKVALRYNGTAFATSHELRAHFARAGLYATVATIVGNGVEIEGEDPGARCRDPRVAREKRAKCLELMTSIRTRDEGITAGDLIERQGYALRWYKGKGVLVHRSREEWSGHCGVPLADWLRERGLTLQQWREQD